MYRIFLIILLITSVLSCSKLSNLEADIANIPMQVSIDRFDIKFNETTLQTLPKLKNDYPYLFPKQYSDDFWEQKIKDTLQQQLNKEVFKQFPSFKAQNKEIANLFKHIKYYFPQFKAPKIITLTTDVDYKNKIILADSLMFIALDTYLGANHFFYGDLPLYISKNLNKDQITQDIAEVYAKQLLGIQTQNSFLEKMLYQGKLLYIKSMFLPETEPYQKIGYTPEEFDWVLANEREIWSYFVEHELLFSTQTKLSSRFISEAPFSKFYLAIDNESPGGVGRYIGWQIVNAYMSKNPKKTLNHLLVEKANLIFNNSNYKPKK